MSQEKIEAIIITDNGIMIQDITVMVSSNHTPILRVPSVEEIVKIADGCSDSLKKMKEKKTPLEELKDTMYNEMVEKHGYDNVKIGLDGALYVTDNGKEHKITVEST